MIHLSRIHDAGSIVINADLIETIESCPDTTITLMTKRKLVVKETLEQVIAEVVEYRRTINQQFAERGIAVDPDSDSANHARKAA